MRKRKQREAPDEQAGADATGALTRSRLTPVDVQQKVFRLAFRGYNERDVDEFLDQVTEDLAALHEENKRLREAVEEARRGGAGSQEATRRAEEIVRQARAHAARLVEEARAGSGGAPASAAPASYLMREREFLQRLASLVQEHAEAMKEEARRSRQPAAPASVAPPAEVAPPPSAPEPPMSPMAPGGGDALAAPAPAAATPAALDEDDRLDLVDEEPEEIDAAGDGEPALGGWDDTPFGDDDSDVSEDDAWLGEDEGADRLPEEMPASNRRRDRAREEPSLKELFWGEE